VSRKNGSRKPKSASRLLGRFVAGLVLVVLARIEEVVLLEVVCDPVLVELLEGLGFGVDGRQSHFAGEQGAVVDRCERVEGELDTAVEVGLVVVVLLEVGLEFAAVGADGQGLPFVGRP